MLSPEKFNYSMLSMYKIPESKLSKSAKLLDEGIFFYGGKFRDGKASNKLRILQIGRKINSWKTIEADGTPPPAIYGHSLHYYAEIAMLILIGGRNEELYRTTSSSCLNDVYILNLSDKYIWSKVTLSGTLPPPRYCFSSVLLNNKILIFGGLSDSNFCNSNLFCLLIDPTEVKKMREEEIKKKEVNYNSDDDELTPTPQSKAKIGSNEISTQNVAEIPDNAPPILPEIAEPANSNGDEKEVSRVASSSEIAEETLE